MRIHGVIRLRETTGVGLVVSCFEIEKRAKQLFHDREIGTSCDLCFSRKQVMTRPLRGKVFFACALAKLPLNAIICFADTNENTS